MDNKKSQIGIEYLLIVGLVIFSIMSIIVIALFYSNTSRDILRENQAESFARKIVSSAESVFYAGEPSRTTISVYLPDGVEKVEIIEDNIVMNVRMNSGLARSAFHSNVPLSGSLSNSPGIQKIKIEATADSVVIGNA